MCYPHWDVVPPPQHPATPRHRHQPPELQFHPGFVFTITSLRDYSACGFLSRPICLCSAAGGSLPSPKLHAGLYKRLAASAAGGSRAAQLGGGARQGLVSSNSLFSFPTGCKSLIPQRSNPRLAPGTTAQFVAPWGADETLLNGGFMGFVLRANKPQLCSVFPLRGSSWLCNIAVLLRLCN